MDPRLALVISVVGAAIAGGVAQFKGRNILGWALFGFVFPYIAVITAVALPTPRDLYAIE